MRFWPSPPLTWRVVVVLEGLTEGERQTTSIIVARTRERAVIKALHAACRGVEDLVWRTARIEVRPET